MYTLKNASLSVSILDPIQDAARLGSRYCTGCYIWQVTSASQGELLTGPEYPEEPNTYDGQGMPDMFFTALGADTAPVGGEVSCIGVGRVRRTSPKEPFYVLDNREVIEFVQWEVEDRSIDREPAIVMRTSHVFQNWAYTLERAVTLAGSNVHSRTAILSTGQALLPVRWFAHPFFPVPPDQVLCRFSFPVSMPDNPGYTINEDGWITQKADHDWKRGYYQPLEYAQDGDTAEIKQNHPKVGCVSVVTDFMPSFLPIWGNDRTFSFEPYFDRQLELNASAGWSITYRFES